MHPIVTFRTRVVGSGKTAAGIVVPLEVLEQLGPSRRPPVRVTINGATYRSTIASMGDRFMVGVSAENRRKTQVAVDDEVEVTLENDTEPREVVVPSDLAEALRTQPPSVAEFFESLSYSQKQWYCYPIETAKTAETRERRVAKALIMLAERRKR